MKKNVLITGVGSSIGFTIALYLLKNNYAVTGCHSITSKDTCLEAFTKIKTLSSYPHFFYTNTDLTNSQEAKSLFIKEYTYIFHLQWPLQDQLLPANPSLGVVHTESFINLLESCSISQPQKLFFLNKEHPSDNAIATAWHKCMELMAQSYSEHYKLPIACLLMDHLEEPTTFDQLFHEKNAPLYSRIKISYP